MSDSCRYWKRRFWLYSSLLPDSNDVADLVINTVGAVLAPLSFPGSITSRSVSLAPSLPVPSPAVFVSFPSKSVAVDDSPSKASLPSVPLKSSPSDSDHLSDLIECIEFLRRQHGVANQLAAFRLVALQYVRNDLYVWSPPISHNDGVLARVDCEIALPQAVVGRLPSDLALAQNEQENGDFYCQFLADSTVVVERLRGLLTSSRYFMTESLSPFKG